MRCNPVMHPALALGCFLWLAAGTAVAQSQDGRVQMIMSKLPPQASTTYRAIRKRAGRAVVQVLTLTKTEMWSVPEDRVAAVKGAAARLGVDVNELAADWNHVFRTMPAHTSMSDEQKAMMAQAMASKAATGVSMMLPPRAAMVEYALTNAAVVVEVDVGETIKLVKAVAAVDCGRTISPDGVANQVEGGIVQAVSWVLKEQVRFDRSRITTRSWDDYPILRFSEAPLVEVTIIDRPDQPSLGMGEAVAGPTAAAIANAVFDAIGVRVRDLPLTRERMMMAINNA